MHSILKGYQRVDFVPIEPPQAISVLEQLFRPRKARTWTFWIASRFLPKLLICCCDNMWGVMIGNDWDFGIVQDEYTSQDDKALMCTWTLPPLQPGLDSCSCCSSCQSMRSRVYIVTKSAGFASRITQLPPLVSYSGFMFINITGGSQKLRVPPLIHSYHPGIQKVEQDKDTKAHLLT